MFYLMANLTEARLNSNLQVSGSPRKNTGFRKISRLLFSPDVFI